MKWRMGVSCLLLTLGCMACDKRPYEEVRAHIIEADSQVQAAEAALKAKAYDQAIATYTEILNQRQENPQMYFKRGYAYYKAGQDQEAITDYTKALELDPQYAEAYAWRALSSGFLGQFEQALSDSQQALRLDPQLPDAYWALGQIYYLSQNYQQALTEYTHAIELNSKHPRAYADRGLAYSELGDYQQALDDYNKTLALEPDARSYNNRAFIYTNLGHYDQALADFRKALELSPGFALGYANIGLTYASLRDFEHAATACQQGIALDAQNCAAHYCLGIVYNGLGGQTRHAQALTHFEQAAAFTCTYFQTEHRANTYVQIGLTKALLQSPQPEILAAYQEAITYAPWHTYAYFLLGEQSVGAEAIRYYTKAIELTPEYALPYVKRGLIFQQQGNLQAARTDFERARERALTNQARLDVEALLPDALPIPQEETP